MDRLGATICKGAGTLCKPAAILSLPARRVKKNFMCLDKDRH